MIRAGLLSILLWSGLAASAETVTFRSGEHADFSRLVAAIPEGTPWEVARRGSGYDVTFGPDVTGFDLSGVFERIPRTRLNAVSASDGVLRLDLGCTCRVEGFLFADDRLVLDIFDGPPETEAANAGSLLPLLAGGGGAAVALPDPFKTGAPRLPDLSATERAIAQSFAEAATQGLLDAATDTVSISRTPGRVAPPGAAPNPRELRDLASAGPAGAPGLGFRTGLEAVDTAATASPATCRDIDFDLSRYQSVDSFAADLAGAQAAIVDPAGRQSDGAIRVLARTYLAYGFGAEAAATLAVAREAEPDDAILFEIASIVDGRPPNGGALAERRDCSPRLRLWNVLAGEGIDLSDAGSTGEIRLAFAALPDPLRRHLAPVLAQALGEEGGFQLADVALAEAPATIETLTVSARIAGLRDGPEAERDALGQLVGTSARIGPDTMLRLLSAADRVGQPVSDETLDLATTLRFEAGRGDIAVSLGRAEISGWLSKGDPDQARGVLEEIRGLLEVDDLRAAASEIATVYADDAPDADFLEMVFSNPLAPLDAAAGNAVAARLIDLGLGDPALRVIEGEASGPDMRERRYLRAEAEALAGDLEGVDHALAGMTERRAQQIRAGAYEAAGDFAAAFGARAIGAAPPSTTDDVVISDKEVRVPDPSGTDAALAWRAGAWTSLEGSDDPLFRETSRARLDAAPVVGTGTPIADRSALLRDAAATRAMATDLLERFDLEPRAAP